VITEISRDRRWGRYLAEANLQYSTREVAQCGLLCEVIEAAKGSLGAVALRDLILGIADVLDEPATT
jgi:hypothetical protein